MSPIRGSVMKYATSYSDISAERHPKPAVHYD